MCNTSDADAIVPDKRDTIGAREPIVVNSEKEREEILYEFHTAPLGRYQDLQRTKLRIKQRYWWVGMDADIENYIKKCSFCQKSKLGLKNRAPMQITDTPSGPFEKGALDIIGPLPETNQGNKVILMFQDHLIKFSKAIPLPNQEAQTVAKAFVTNIVCEYVTPEKILTDRSGNALGERTI